MKTIFPEPNDSSPMGHWAAYFAQNPLARWQDIADALGTTRGAARAGAVAWCIRNRQMIPRRGLPRVGGAA